MLRNYSIVNGGKMFIVILIVAISIASTHVSDKNHGKPTSNEIYERELEKRK